MAKEPKVRWVKSWRDMPNGRGDTVAGVRDNIVYAVKGKASKTDIEHEKGHIVLGHTKKKRFPSAISHAREEIAAEYYTYKKTGQPQHILSILRGIYNDLAGREWAGTYKTAPQILRVIRDALKRHKIPITWKRDYAKLVEAVRTKEGF